MKKRDRRKNRSEEGKEVKGRKEENGRIEGKGWIGRSVGDPDPHVFEPSGYESIGQRYGSGSFPLPINVLSGLKYCLTK
jgi:hypothetical protein